MESLAVAVAGSGTHSGSRVSDWRWSLRVLKSAVAGFSHDPNAAVLVHKTATVLNHLPKSQQLQAKSALHEIYMAETKAQANKAFNRFIKTYEAKYPKAPSV